MLAAQRDTVERSIFIDKPFNYFVHGYYGPSRGAATHSCQAQKTLAAAGTDAREISKPTETIVGDRAYPLHPGELGTAKIN